jgi:hypothetical protein
MPTNVIRFATCKCDKGSAPTALMAAAAPTCVNNQVAATITDTQFVGTFGTCKILGGPCEYAPAATWTQPAFPALFSGLPPLVKGAKLLCKHGGMIEVIDPGQSAVCTEEQLEAVNAEIKKLKEDLKQTMIGLGLDLAGVFDPSPVSDTASAINSFSQGDVVGGLLSGVSVVPFAGDSLAKPIKGAKIAKKLDKLRRSIRDAENVQKALEKAKTVAESKELVEIKGLKTLSDIDKGIQTTRDLDRERDQRHKLGIKAEKGQ